MNRTVVVVFVLLASSKAFAQVQSTEARTELVQNQSVKQSPGEHSFTLGGILSIQPSSGVNSVYLSKGIGGNRPGISAGYSFGHIHGATFGVEGSTTLAMSATQSGRIVRAGGPLEGRHTDVMLSALVGYRSGTATHRVEYKGGGSFALGLSSRESDPVESPRGSIALTGGVDWSIGVKARTAVLLGARYSYVFREDNNYVLGLGNQILRFGAGFSWYFD